MLLWKLNKSNLCYDFIFFNEIKFHFHSNLRDMIIDFYRLFASFFLLPFKRIAFLTDLIYDHVLQTLCQ